MSIIINVNGTVANRQLAISEGDLSGDENGDPSLTNVHLAIDMLPLSGIGGHVDESRSVAAAAIKHSR